MPLPLYRPLIVIFSLLLLTPVSQAQWWYFNGTSSIPRVVSGQNNTANTGGNPGAVPGPFFQVGPNPQPAPGPSSNTIGATLFNFGTSAGDTLFPKNDDLFQRVSWAGAGPEGTSLSMPFFNSRFQHTYVDNNGLLSFNSGISAYTASPLPVPSLPYPIIAPFFADVDTRAANGGNVWYRTTQSAAELASIGSKVMSSVSGLTNFAPTFAQVVTWDRVGSYASNAVPTNAALVSTFQAVVATDGLQTYTLFLYPNRAIWWDRGALSPADSFAQVGVTDGTATNTLTFAGTGTSAVRDLWFLSNTADNSPGTFVFDVSGTATDLTVSGTHTLTAASPTVVPTLSLSANPAGHFITGTAATVDGVTVNPSLQFNSLQFADATNRVTFQANAVAIARGANAITHGHLTFTDTSRLVAGSTGALNGGTITLQKDAKLALYAAGATTGATTLVFDQTAGSTGGTLDLRGFNTTLGAISSANSTPGAGVITNSGTAAATLTTQFDSASLTFSGTLQDGTASLALVKQGSGTLTLTGANTYTRGTSVLGGTLALQGGGTLGAAGRGLTLGDATLDLGSSQVSVGALTFTGNATINRTTGSLSATSISAAPASGTLTLAGAFGGTGQFTKSGAGTVVLTGANTYSGGTTISAGTLQIGAGSNTGSVSGAIVNHATLAFSRSDATTHGGDISGTGQVVVTNPGGASFFLRLSGNNTYSGGTTLTAGSSVLLGHANALGSGLITLHPNSILFASSYNVNLAQLASPGSDASAIVTTSGAYTYDSASSANLVVRLQGGSSGLTKAGSGTLTLSGTNSYSGTTTISSGTLQIGSGSTTGTLGSGNVVNHATLLFNRADALTVAHEISGPGLVGATGPGTLTLTGNNSYTGGTTLGAGTLALGSANALGATGTLSFTGGTLQFSAANTTDYSARFSNAASQAYRVDTNAQSITLASALTSSGGTLTKLGAGTLTLTGANSFSGTTTVSTGTLQIGNGGTTGSLNGPIVNDATLAFNRSNALLHGGTISGTGAVTVTNGGGAGNYLRLGGANTYSGGTTLTTGSSVLLGHASALGSGPVTLQENTILFATSFNVDLTKFTNPGNAASAIVTTSGAYTYDATASATLGVRLQGFTTGLTKLGSGTLTLTSANSYSGTTTVSAGTLQIGNGGTTGSLGFDSVINHAALAFNRSNAFTVGNPISGTGTVSQLGSGTLTLIAANTYSGGTTIASGTLKLANTTGSALGSGPVALTTGATLTGPGSFTGALTVAGTVSPGNSPGTLSAGATTFAAGGSYAWEINNATGVSGTNYDLLAITGTLNITATTSSPFAINVTSLLPDNSPGSVINFNSAQNYAYTIATASAGITGFSASAFTLNTAGFTNPLNGGTWSLAAHGNNLDLTFTASAIPEPSTYAAILGALSLAVAWRRRVAARRTQNRSRSS